MRPSAADGESLSMRWSIAIGQWRIDPRSYGRVRRHHGDRRGVRRTPLRDPLVAQSFDARHSHAAQAANPAVDLFDSCGARDRDLDLWCRLLWAHLGPESRATGIAASHGDSRLRLLLGGVLHDARTWRYRAGGSYPVYDRERGAQRIRTDYVVGLIYVHGNAALLEGLRVRRIKDESHRCTT